MTKFNRVESQDYFPAGSRLHMTMNLQTKSLHINKEGREATEPEVYTALWQYHQALYEAEKQIKEMAKLLESLVDDFDEVDEVYDYLHDHADLSDREEVMYKFEESKEALFVAMAKKDASVISMHINRINLMMENIKSEEEEVSND